MNTLEQYSGDIVAALTPDKWLTKKEIDVAVEKIQTDRFDTAHAGEFILSPRAFVMRHVVGLTSSTTLRQALADLVQQQFVVHRPRPEPPGSQSKFSRWEYGLHPTRRLQISGGKRAPTLAGLAGAHARTT